jgi:hypothetical protein
MNDKPTVTVSVSMLVGSFAACYILAVLPPIGAWFA